MTHHMTPTEFESALTTLNLTPEQAATWLGIGRSTAYRYLKTGCEGPVAGMVRERLRVRDLEQALTYADAVLGRVEPNDARAMSEEYVSLAAALCDVQNEEGRIILARGIERVNALPDPFQPEVTFTAIEDSLALDWRE